MQGVLGVIVANIDMLVGCAGLEPTWRAVVVALVMAEFADVAGAAAPDDERKRWEELHGEGIEAAAPDDWEPEEGEDDCFKEVPDGV